MTVKLIKADRVHKELEGFIVSLFVKNPALLFKEVDFSYINSEKVADEFTVYFNTDEVGKIFFRDGKIWVRSPLINNERKPYNDFRTKNAKAAIRKAREVFVPEAVGDVGGNICMRTRDAMDNLKYCAYRKLPDLSSSDVVSFFRHYKFSDIKLPIPSAIDARLTDATIQAIDEHEIVSELHKLSYAKNGYALREDVDGSMTIVKMDDESILYRGKSTYDLPEWMQSKVTILKLLENNQAARNIGCKMDRDGYIYYFIVDGQIPGLIE